MDVELADAVASVRDELMAAASRGAGAGLEFVVGPLELEFAVELRHDANVRSGFKAWVVSAEAEGGTGRTRTHTVKVTLTPRRVGGGDLLVGARPGAADAPGDVSEHVGR